MVEVYIWIQFIQEGSLFGRSIHFILSNWTFFPFEMSFALQAFHLRALVMFKKTIRINTDTFNGGRFVNRHGLTIRFGFFQFLLKQNYFCWKQNYARNKHFERYETHLKPIIGWDVLKTFNTPVNRSK